MLLGVCAYIFPTGVSICRVWSRWLPEVEAAATTGRSDELPDDPELGEGAIHMTTDECTPVTGSDSIELTDEWPPLQDESDETVALAVEERKYIAEVLAERLSGALLNEEEELSEDDVADLLVLGNDLRGLAANLMMRTDESADC
jgi:hypothetical protein